MENQESAASNPDLQVPKSRMKFLEDPAHHARGVWDFGYCWWFNDSPELLQNSPSGKKGILPVEQKWCCQKEFYSFLKGNQKFFCSEPHLFPGKHGQLPRWKLWIQGGKNKSQWLQMALKSQTALLFSRDFIPINTRD